MTIDTIKIEPSDDTRVTIWFSAQLYSFVALHEGGGERAWVARLKGDTLIEAAQDAVARLL